jgi:hypothetical protein
MAGVTIVDFAKEFKKHGWTPGEHPGVGTGRVGKHAPGSYHYSGQAIDVTRQGPDMSAAYSGAPLSHWKDLTGDLKFRAKKSGIFTEVLGPGDPGHSTHTHLALKGPVNATPELMQWIATGRYKTPEGKLTDVMPGAQPSTSQQQQQTPATATAGNIYNFYLQGKKKEDEDMASLLPNPTDFLTGYINKPSVNSLAALQAAFNSGGALMT